MSQYPLQPTSSIICFTYSNHCLPFILLPSTVPSEIVPINPSSLSACPINLLRHIFILERKFLFSFTKFKTSSCVTLSTSLFLIVPYSPTFLKPLFFYTFRPCFMNIKCRAPYVCFEQFRFNF